MALDNADSSFSQDLCNCSFLSREEDIDQYFSAHVERRKYDISNSNMKINYDISAIDAYNYTYTFYRSEYNFPILFLTQLD